MNRCLENYTKRRIVGNVAEYIRQTSNQEPANNKEGLDIPDISKLGTANQRKAMFENAPCLEEVTKEYLAYSWLQTYVTKRFPAPIKNMHRCVDAAYEGIRQGKIRHATSRLEFVLMGWMDSANANQIYFF